MKKTVIGIFIIALITGLLVFFYSKNFFYRASAQQQRFMTEIDAVNSIVWYYGNVNPGKEINFNIKKVEHFSDDTIGDVENEYQYHAVVIIDFDGKMDLSDEELFYIKKCCEEKYYDLLYYGTEHLDQFKKCGYFEVLDESNYGFSYNGSYWIDKEGKDDKGRYFNPYLFTGIWTDVEEKRFGHDNGHAVWKIVTIGIHRFISDIYFDKEEFNANEENVVAVENEEVS